DVGAATRAVFYDELLAEAPREPRSDEPRNNVGRAARGCGGDDAHRPRRIGLRPSKVRDCRERGSARGQMQEYSAGELHLAPPFTSFDHLVGDGEHAWGNGEAEQPRGLSVDDQLELARLDDRQVRGLGALEDATGIDAALTKRIREVGSVAHQPADLGI